MSQELFDVELGRYDWAALACGCGGPADHLPGEFRRLAAASSDSEATLNGIFDHVSVNEVLYEPAVPAASVTLAALAGELAVPARRSFLELLLGLVAGESQAFNVADPGRDLLEECRFATASGIWLLHAEVFAGRGPALVSLAYELLTLVEEDEERLSLVQSAAGERLRWDLRN